VAAELCGEQLAERFDGELGDRVGSPERAGMPADTARRKNDGCIGRGTQRRQQHLRQRKCRRGVHVQHPVPVCHRVMLERRERTEHRCVVHQAVEPSVAREQCGSQRFIFRSQRPFQIERRDARLSQSKRGYLGMHSLQAPHGAADQHQFGTLRGGGQRHGPANAVASAGDCDDAPGK